MKTKIIAIVNQKGGVGKTATTLNLGAELAKKGKKVLLIDFDPQGNLSIALGISEDVEPSIADLMQLEMEDNPLPEREDIIINTASGLDVICSNLELSAIEMLLVTTTCREFILKSILKNYKDDYDYILIDCGPSLGMLLVNALTAANSIIIPVEGNYLPAKGLEQLLQSVARTKRKLNPNLEIEGILFTKIDTRTNMAVEVIEEIQKVYGGLKIFKNVIPLRVSVEKAIRNNKSVSEFEQDDKAAEAYIRLAREVIGNE